MKFEIEMVDNGYIASWWDDAGEEMVQHHKVFEVSDNIDLRAEDPQSLIDLLYFVKDEICGQYSSKHKKTNIRVVMEELNSPTCPLCQNAYIGQGEA